MVPRAAREQYAAQQSLAALALHAVTRSWRKIRGRTWEQAWRDDVGPEITRTLTAGQEAAVARSGQYVAEVLTELGVQSQVETTLVPSAFAGVAGDGRDVEGLAYGAVITAAKARYTPEGSALDTREAADYMLAQGEKFLAEITAALMADTARAAETAAIAERDWITGYIRMIEPGACSRCAVLAGKFYLYNDGFERHPRCRCIHIPAVENIPHDPLTNPDAYFNSLSRTDQDRIFTTAGAEAIRQGADIFQVVNARRGMSTAQQNPAGWIPKGRMEAVRMDGRDVFVTTEGVTKAGIYGRIRGRKPVRLMPESIVAIATDRADLVRLLKVYGYIT